MNVNIYIGIICSMLTTSCTHNHRLNTENLEEEALELWMINNSKEIKKRTTYSFFRISPPAGSYRSKLILNSVDSLNILSIQEFNANDDKFPDLIVYAGKTPYAIINNKRPLILNLQRDNHRETIAHVKNRKSGTIEIFESHMDTVGEKLTSYEIILWNDRLIENNPAPDDQIKSITYLSYIEKKVFKITRNGNIYLLDFNFKELDEDNNAHLRSGIVAKERLAELVTLLERINFRIVEPIEVQGLHVPTINLFFESSTNNFQLKDIGKRGSFSLMALYNLTEEIIEETNFHTLEKFNLDRLYKENFEPIYKFFEIDD